MNNKAQPEAADKRSTFLLYSAPDGLRTLRTEGIEITELGVRSIRRFFLEHPMATYAAALAYRGLFGLFLFVLIVVVLASALG